VKGSKGRYRDGFYRNYLIYTGLETDLLFFVVCDAMFLTQVKHLSLVQYSRVTFLSLLFSLLIQYPLLKCINRTGNRAAVRAGSIFMLLSAVCITFSTGFFMVLLGGILKCIGHTFNTIGTAILKNKLEREHREDQYVAYQSDANTAASAVMMLTSLLCGYLFRLNEYLPMYACILFSLAGVAVSFYISCDNSSATEIISADRFRQLANEHKQTDHSYVLLILVAFSLFTALTGTGLSYARLNFQELLNGHGSEKVVFFLSAVTSVIYLIRVVSNVMLKETYAAVKSKAVIIAASLSVCGLLLQLLPWIKDTGSAVVILCTGYLLLAFIRDPFITVIQNMSLESNESHRQQGILIALNGAKKAGALALSAAATLLLNSHSVFLVMVMMAVAAAVNLLLCIVIVLYE
jgi:hypothetical protein